MTDKTKNTNRGLIYVILLCFLGLIATSYFLIRSMQEVQELTSHKKVLIRRLAEEVTAKKHLQKEVDSLKEILDGQKLTPISSDVQTVIP